MDYHIIKLEGQRGVIQILLYLYEHGETLYGKLFNNQPNIEISNNATANRALEILLKYNLVNRRMETGRNAHYYSLTSKGEKFVSCIKNMEKILREY